MLKVFKTNSVDKKIKKIKKITMDCWMELTTPTNDEIDKVVAKTLVDKDLITKMLDVEELPRIERSGNATLIVVDTPYLDEDHQYTTIPLGIIITDNNYVITVSPKKTTILNAFKQDKVKDFRTAKKTRFLIQILLHTAATYLRVLKQVSRDIDQKEEELKKSTKNKDLVDMLEIEKTLVYFMTSLKSNDVVLGKLSKGNILPLYENDGELLEDAIIEYKQAMEMTTIYKGILLSIKDTYSTVVSNNLNIAMKFLAAATIVLSIPTMISSFLGMNIDLGRITEMDNAFPLVIIISLITSLLVAILLKKKDMF
ncbi:MAG: magnesium transporter CorA family protein [Bacilli bacterium]|nr:magnesium transporter CorA family protein [Bacilli bacterium]